MLKKSLFILFIYSAVLLVSEIAYRHIFDVVAINRYFETFAIIFAITSLFYFAKYKVTRFVLGLFFALSVIIQNVHYAVYEGWITSTNYLLMFTEITEITRAGVTMLDKVLPAALWGVAELIFFLSIARFRTKTFVLADGLFWLMLIYMSLRSFRSDNDIGLTPRDNYSRLKANNYSFHSFIGRILPSELLNLSDVPDYIHPMPELKSAPQVKHIVLIVGESVSAKHIQGWGYNRPTTPFLDSMMQNPQALVRETYAAGLSTAISLPAFFNAIPRPNGLKQIAKGDTNLFNLAKKQGFITDFHTSQPQWEMEIIGSMGKAWIDNISFPTDKGYSLYDSMNDHLLLPYLYDINLDTEQKRFIVLHQRGSHVPYAKDLLAEERLFKQDTPLDKYDSTVYHTDLMIKKVYEHLSQRSQDDWLLIYTSDHGQYVTNEVYNQGTTLESNYLVPFLVYSPNKVVQQQVQAHFAQCQRAFHQQISTFIIATLGFDMPVSGCNKGTINSLLLSGNSGYLEVEGNKVEFVYPKEQPSQ